jgi:hypothetical protein
MSIRTSTLLALPLLLLFTPTPAPSLAAPGTGGIGGAGPPPPGPWPSSAVADSGKDWGAYASMATTMSYCSSGGAFYPCTRLGIAFFNKTNGDLMFTSSTDGGQNFTTSTVDTGPNGDIVGAHASLAFHGVTPFISYQDSTTGLLRLAHKVTDGTGNCGTNNGWQCKSLGSSGLFSSIGITSSGQVVIGHARSGGGVKVERLDPPYTSFATTNVSSASAKSVALVVDDINQAHVAWSNGLCVYYSYGFFEATETVECSPSNPTYDAGRISMAVNTSERPHLAYVLNTASGGYSVRHSFKVDYQTWAHEHVSFVVNPQPGTSILLDQDDIDTAAIGWGTPVNGIPSLVVASPGAIYGWSAYKADQGGSYSTMAWYAGKVVAAHYDDNGAGGGDLRFSKNE